MNLKESIRRILRESIPPQVKRRSASFDESFIHYRDRYLEEYNFRNFNIFWGQLMEQALGTLYHAWFVNTVPDDEWEESERYVKYYLTDKYYNETKRMWENKQRNKLNESEDKVSSTLNQLVNVLFDGFDNADYDWANYNCGMGECCDPYAIGFTLPDKDYDDYIFKLVDGEMYDDDAAYPEEFQDELPEPCYQQPDLNNPRFDTIVFYGSYAEEIEDYMGPERNWKSDLLKIINKQFGCDAKRIVII